MAASPNGASEKGAQRDWLEREDVQCEGIN